MYICFNEGNLWPFQFLLFSQLIYVLESQTTFFILAQLIFMLRM